MSERSSTAITVWLIATMALFLFVLPRGVAELTRRGVPLAIAYAVGAFVIVVLAIAGVVLLSRRPAAERNRQVKMGIAIVIAMTLLVGGQIAIEELLQTWQLPAEIVEYGSWLGAILVAGGTGQVVMRKLGVERVKSQL